MWQCEEIVPTIPEQRPGVTLLINTNPPIYSYPGPEPLGQHTKFSKEACTKFHARPGIEPGFCSLPGEFANHYTTDNCAVSYYNVQYLKQLCLQFYINKNRILLFFTVF